MIRKLAQLDKATLMQSAERALSKEMEGLNALKTAISGALVERLFDVACLIGTLDGRLIVTGVGKSGHIGAKIASTFSSTGTPAIFVHPSEANHGDLGMIGRNDIVVALSWSGETAELQGILSYVKRFEIPLVGITAGEGSALHQAADYSLLLPKQEEACPHNLAPTTSSLMQLAIGDALAVALLEARGFTASDFRTFHPGGNLGASLTQVSEIMHVGDEVPIVKLGTLVPNAALVLSEKRFGCVGVVDENDCLVGIVTDGDIARNMANSLREVRVEDLMTHSPKTVSRDTLAMSAMALLNAHNITALLVVSDDGSNVEGIIGFHDLLKIGVA